MNRAEMYEDSTDEDESALKLAIPDPRGTGPAGVGTREHTFPTNCTRLEYEEGRQHRVMNRLKERAVYQNADVAIR